MVRSRGLGAAGQVRWQNITAEVFVADVRAWVSVQRARNGSPTMLFPTLAHARAACQRHRQESAE
jgi:hypothetical protein